MPYSGLGTFVRLYNWVTDAANNIYVRADRMDAEMDGIATGLSNCITKDGQQILTANIPFGGYKITGLGSGASTTDAVNYAQVFSSPTFTTPYAVAMPTLGSNNLLLATTSYVDQTAFATANPAIPATGNYYLGSSAGVAGWTLRPVNPSVYASANGL